MCAGNRTDEASDGFWMGSCCCRRTEVLNLTPPNSAKLGSTCQCEAQFSIEISLVLPIKMAYLCEPITQQALCRMKDCTRVDVGKRKGERAGESGVVVGRHGDKVESR